MGTPAPKQRGCSADLALIGRAVGKTFAFDGRSRRTELVIYLMVSGWAAQLLAAFGSSMQLGAQNRLSFFLGLLVTIPVPSLLVRRMHDIGRSGWWSVPLILLVTALAFAEWASLAASAAQPFLPFSPDILASKVIPFAGIAMLAFISLIPPGSDNPYGPDPQTV